MLLLTLLEWMDIERRRLETHTRRTKIHTYKEYQVLGIGVGRGLYYLHVRDVLNTLTTSWRLQQQF